jgi:peptide deformylase
MLRIVTYPNKSLTKASRAVTSFDARLRDLSFDMLKAMKANDGAGLAAPQIGKSIALFVVASGLLPHDAVCNPKWTPREGNEKVRLNEGCLSFPGVFLDIPRYTEILVEYQDIRGKIHEMELTGFAAHVFQHESEHLDGVLMIDHLA